MSAGAGSPGRARETIVARSDDEMAAFGAELLGRAIVSAVSARGVARVALSGGSTPGETYRRLAKLALPWERVEWFWVDERAVGPSHERSNYRAASADLGLETEPVRAGEVLRMRGEAGDLAEAAKEYEQILRARFGVAKAVAFDAMTLGIGDDGHTASLFPGMGTVGASDRLVLSVAAQPDKGLEARLTLTAPVICEARFAMVLAKGKKKRDVIVAARSPGPEDEVPSRIFQRIEGDLVWLLDEAAVP